MKIEVREDIETLRIAVHYQDYRNLKKMAWHGIMYHETSKLLQLQSFGKQLRVHYMSHCVYFVVSCDVSLKESRKKERAGTAAMTVICIKCCLTFMIFQSFTKMFHIHQA